jgi:predicted metal-dependent RNase
MGTILNSIPAEAQITRIEYEGPRIALYTKNPKYLHQNNYIISEIVNSVKKRVVTRTEKSIRKPEQDEGDPREGHPRRSGRLELFLR